MQNRLIHIAVGCALAFSIASAQTPAPAADPSGVVVAHPTYVFIPMESHREPALPAKCGSASASIAISAKWLQTTCTISTQAKTMARLALFGSIGGEVLVGKTELSYTYTQPPRAGRPYNLYHGTLEARPIDGDYIEAPFIR